MRPMYVIMVGVAACTLATPASADWQDRTYSQQLQVQIDAGVRQGTISRRESIGLRQDLGQLVRLERRFSPDGISGREHAQLLQRSTPLAKEIRFASGKYNLRTHPATWTSGNICRADLLLIYTRAPGLPLDATWAVANDGLTPGSRSLFAALN